MRAFLLAPIALAAAVSAAQLEQRSPFHAIASSLVTRAQIVDPSIIPDQCKKACADSVHDANTCTDINCVCTKSNGKQLNKCVNCLVNVAGTDTSTTVGQDILDTFSSECKADGIDVGNYTVGSSSSALHLVANGGGIAAALAVMVAYLF